MADTFLLASQDYLHRRHEIALRLLAECDKQAPPPATNETAKDQPVQQRRSQLREESDRLCAALATLEQRGQLLQSAPPAIEDPYIGGVDAYLQRRHEVALRLAAAMDAEMAELDARRAKLAVQRDQLNVEVDTLLAAQQMHEERTEILETSRAVLGDNTPDTSLQLGRVLAYLDARSAVVLKLIAGIDAQLSAAAAAAPEGQKEDPEAAKGRAHLTSQRSELTAELDRVNEQISSQKRGEEDLQACGLKSDAGDPYHTEITAYLENRSEVALKLIAFLDQRLDRVNQQEATASDEERAQIVARRDALRREADEALSQIAREEKGKALMEKVGTAAMGYQALA